MLFGRSFVAVILVIALCVGSAVAFVGDDAKPSITREVAELKVRLLSERFANLTLRMQVLRNEASSLDQEKQALQAELDAAFGCRYRMEQLACATDTDKEPSADEK